MSKISKGNPMELTAITPTVMGLQVVVEDSMHSSCR